jgi:ribose transport system substrate-binding protein
MPTNRRRGYRQMAPAEEHSGNGRNALKRLILLAAAAAMALAGPAVAQNKKQLVIVVKGLDNAYFESMHQGCLKWNAQNPDSDYECFYTGPASTSDEAGEAQILQDMLAKPSTAGIAISPSNAPLIAQTLRSSNPTIPIMTVDADLNKEDQSLRKTYLGTDNYTMGFKIGEYIKKAKPSGGTICTIEGGAAADNILQRAQGMRDALTGQKGLTALTGQGGWTEVKGCPVFTNDDGAKGVQAMADILAANPKLDAFGIMGGWPLFGAPQAYRDLMKPLASKIADNEFAVGSADTIGDEVNIAKEGLVTALVGQRPFQMGEMAPDVLIKLIKGEKVSDPVFTGLDECTKANIDTCITK